MGKHGETMTTTQSGNALWDLRAERARLKKRIDEIDATLNELSKEQRREELAKNVGKYFAKTISKTCKEYYFVIGIDEKLERNEVLAVAVGDKWLRFEQTNIPFRVEQLRQVPRSEFIKQMRKIEPFFKRAMKGKT
jgi:chaperonin cofactor prefoldin